MCLGFYSQAIAQTDAEKTKAEEYYNQARVNAYGNDFKAAIDYCFKAIEEDSTYVDPYHLLGSILETLHRDSDIIVMYTRLLAVAPNDFDGYMGRADAEVKRLKYDDAEADYRAAVALKGTPAKYHNVAVDRLDKMSYIRYLVAHPVPFNPENLGSNINSTDDEYFPTFTVDGETMYFTRRKLQGTKDFHGMTVENYNEDIMMSTKINGQWSPAQDIPGPINTPDNNEGAMCIAPDGTYLIYTSCVQGNCDLYISFFVDGDWTKPVNMGDPINTRFNEKQTSISADGRTIYFASDRPGGLGGLDLWSSTRDDNWNFGEPVNLGPNINTKLDDQAPFIHPDNQTLYFISLGHKGMGRNDIFYSRRDAFGKWDSAVNLGYPINTPGDEPGLVIDRLGDYAYFSSEREGGYGKLDIYRFKLPKPAKPHPVTYLKAHVTDIETHKPLRANLELIDLETGKSFLKTICSKNGDVEAVLPGGKDYMVNVSDSAYLFFSDNIPLKNYHLNNPYLYNIQLKPIKTGQTINLKNVFFPTDGFSLEDKSKSELDKLASFLRTNPKVKLEIGGHTDNTGSPEHNKDLSTRRAKAVYDYLTTSGKIDTKRLSYVGYGDSKPIVPNTTEAGKAKNRRTEVKIME